MPRLACPGAMAADLSAASVGSAAACAPRTRGVRPVSWTMVSWERDGSRVARFSVGYVVWPPPWLLCRLMPTLDRATLRFTGRRRTLTAIVAGRRDRQRRSTRSPRAAVARGLGARAGPQSRGGHESRRRRGRGGGLLRPGFRAPRAPRDRPGVPSLRRRPGQGRPRKRRHRRCLRGLGGADRQAVDRPCAPGVTAAHLRLARTHRGGAGRQRHTVCRAAIQLLHVQPAHVR